MIFLIIIILITTLKFRIQIENCKFDSIKNQGRYFNNDYKIIIRLQILGKITITKIKLTKEKMEKWKLSEKLDKNIKKIETKMIEDNTKFDKKIIEAIKSLDVKIKDTNLKIALGTEDAFLTSIIVPILSTVIVIILSRKISNYNNQKIIIQPLFYNQNRVNISFSGIFEFKMIHIINMIYILNKKGRVNKHERTSNRRSYDYSYE